MEGGGMAGLDESHVLMKLSYARAALDDPEQVGLENPGERVDPSAVRLHWGMEVYAVEKIDDAMGMLNTALRPALALKTVCQLIAEVRNQEAAKEDDDDAQTNAADLDKTLRLLDAVVARLR
jgi:hypothetical protein